MKRADVRVGEAYAIRIQKQECRVRIESARSNGGWDATNLATGKEVRIKNPSGLKALPTTAEGGDGGEVTAIVAEPEVEATVAEPVGPAGKKLSAIDAAARVLAEAGTPMNAKQMIDAMTANEFEFAVIDLGDLECVGLRRET
jgi:hypothetical protein